MTAFRALLDVAAKVAASNDARRGNPLNNWLDHVCDVPSNVGVPLVIVIRNSFFFSRFKSIFKI